eukprot:6203349-Pleurochrysis_carterae.AAC.3
MGFAILRHASEQLSVCTRSWARSRSRRRARVLRTAALEARRVPAEPSARQQLRRQAVIFGLARCEVEEALSFAVDCVFAGLSGGNFSLLEQKAARLYNHHNQRWPMITWLMGLATPTMARPLIRYYKSARLDVITSPSHFKGKAELESASSVADRFHFHYVGHITPY